MYDIAIVGLGPAGAALARLLAGKYKVAAVDQKGPARGFEKPCGGLLAPDAQKALARLGLTLPKSLLAEPQIFSVRTIDLAAGLTRWYQRFYLNLDRAKFDQWMIEQIPESATVELDSRCAKIERIEGGFRVHYRRGGEEKQLECRTLVGADGANSIVRRTFFSNKKIRSYVAVQQWFQDQNPNPFYSCVFDNKATDCYSWSICKDGYFIFGGAYPPKDCRRRFEDQKRALESRGFRFGAPVKTEACQVLRPQNWRQFCIGGKGVFLLGEAAGFISPSSLEGVSWALNSAMALAEALDSPEPRRSYSLFTLGMRLRLTAKLLKCPAMYQPALRRLVLRSGLQALDLLDGQEEGE